jgi:hypothetical protein
MKLPNPEHAIVDLKKLRDYCLSSEHPRGRHKARMFAAILGLTAKDAEELQRALLSAAHTYEAFSIGGDDYGQRYAVDFPLDGLGGTAAIRSLWIVRDGENFPRLITCYVL